MGVAMQRTLRVILGAGLAVGSSVGTCLATDVGVSPLKLIVVDKLAASGTAKAVFVAKDAGITKGTGDDASDISASLDVKYDNGTDTPIAGQWVAPSGTNWVVNKDTVAKYVNKDAPSGGDTKVAVIKPGNLVKLVGKGIGDTPLNILSQSNATSGVANTGYCVDNGADSNCFCSTLTTCVWKPIAADTGAKLVCKGGVPDDGCTALGGGGTTTSSAPPTTTVTSTTTSTSIFSPPACGSAVAPQCDGTCAAGESCIDSGTGCVCSALATACGSSIGPPDCWGECSPGAACIEDGIGGCMCAP